MQSLILPGIACRQFRYPENLGKRSQDLKKILLTVSGGYFHLSKGMRDLLVVFLDEKILNLYRRVSIFEEREE